MKLLFIALAIVTIVLAFATYSNGLAFLAFAATCTVGYLAMRKGRRENK